jgi:hypothetical protein
MLPEPDSPWAFTVLFRHSLSYSTVCEQKVSPPKKIPRAAFLPNAWSDPAVASKEQFGQAFRSVRSSVLPLDDGHCWHPLPTLTLVRPARGNSPCSLPAPSAILSLLGSRGPCRGRDGACLILPYTFPLPHRLRMRVFQGAVTAQRELHRARLVSWEAHYGQEVVRRQLSLRRQ